MGYPLWGELVGQLAQEFAPTLALSDDYLNDVDKIAASARSADKLAEYHKRLERTFCVDGASRTDLGFHRRLISLGFCGLITSNFDPTLERACTFEFSGPGDPHQCDSVDLRDQQKPYLVYEFLRKLGASQQHDRVLHLHGFHNRPDRLILGTRDYAEAYGHDLGEPDAALKTLLRKIIWALFATRPVLFVGFSRTDAFFNKTLELVKSDFVLTDEPSHYAIVPYEVDVSATAGVLDPSLAHDEARTKIRATLPRWMVPIFYHAPRHPMTGRQDHSQLAVVISELAGRVSTVPQAESVVDRLARRALEDL
jgi:hypothetical protein